MADTDARYSVRPAPQAPQGQKDAQPDTDRSAGGRMDDREPPRVEASATSHGGQLLVVLGTDSGLGQMQSRQGDGGDTGRQAEADHVRRQARLTPVLRGGDDRAGLLRRAQIAGEDLDEVGLHRRVSGAPPLLTFLDGERPETPPLGCVGFGHADIDPTPQRLNRRSASGPREPAALLSAVLFEQARHPRLRRVHRGFRPARHPHNPIAPTNAHCLLDTLC